MRLSAAQEDSSNPFERFKAWQLRQSLDVEASKATLATEAKLPELKEAADEAEQELKAERDGLLEAQARSRNGHVTVCNGRT